MERELALRGMAFLLEMRFIEPSANVRGISAWFTTTPRMNIIGGLRGWSKWEEFYISRQMMEFTDGNYGGVTVH